jgi:pimeloyl-ACP methyl ester carboxylesterase
MTAVADNGARGNLRPFAGAVVALALVAAVRFANRGCTPRIGSRRRLLWPQLLEVDLFERVPRMDVPVFLMEGRHDQEVPADLAEKYFEAP